MATRLDRDRRPATASSVWLGDPRPAAPEYGPDSPHPITTRDIHTVGRHIGWLYHRDYDSGYPGRYELGMLAGRPWSFYDTEDDAVRGAEEYAAGCCPAARPAAARPGTRRPAPAADPDRPRRSGQHPVPAAPVAHGQRGATPGRPGVAGRRLRPPGPHELPPRPDRRRRLPGRRRVSPEAGSTPEEPGGVSRASRRRRRDLVAYVGRAARCRPRRSGRPRRGRLVAPHRRARTHRVPRSAARAVAAGKPAGAGLPRPRWCPMSQAPDRPDRSA